LEFRAAQVVLETQYFTEPFEALGGRNGPNHGSGREDRLTERISMRSSGAVNRRFVERNLNG
jgi:hypothetical protein